MTHDPTRARRRLQDKLRALRTGNIAWFVLAAIGSVVYLFAPGGGPAGPLILIAAAMFEVGMLAMMFLGMRRLARIEAFQQLPPMRVVQDGSTVQRP